MALRPSVENLRALGQWTQGHRWGLQFIRLPSVLSGYRSEDLNYRAESITLPRLNTPTSDIEVRGNMVHQTGKGEYEKTITLTAIETVNNIVQHFIHDWREHHWELGNGSTGKTADKNLLEAELQITLLNNVDLPRWSYTLIGCILEGGEPGLEPANEADPQKPVLNITYDRFDESWVDHEGFGEDIA